MSVRAVTVLWLMMFASWSDAAADILRCQLKSVSPGYQELLVDIVVPNREDYRYDLSLVDARTGDIRQLPKSDVMPWPLQKALGTIEIRARVFGGEYGKTERSNLIAFGPFRKDELIAIVAREGIRAFAPGMVKVHLVSGNKTITMADTTHLVDRLSIYEGKCE
jgi:hypothetical protein